MGIPWAIPDSIFFLKKPNIESAHQETGPWPAVPVGGREVGKMNCANCKVWVTMSGDAAQRVCAACQKKMAALKSKSGSKVSSL
jgi:hypothetical protein